MFDDGESSGWAYNAVRPKKPPEDVEVDMSQVLPAQRLRWGRETPIWCRAYGVGGGRVRGLLQAWVMSSTGDWWALVDLTLVSSNGRTTLPVRQLVHKNAVRPAGEA